MGNRNNNDGTLNNAGTNGNYWSSTQNDSNNAYNLNFNSGNADWNNNNRNNGQSVRAVAELNGKREQNLPSLEDLEGFITLIMFAEQLNN